MEHWKKNPAIYEINTRVWLGEIRAALERKITLDCVPDEQWDELGRLGIDAVWFMGIWERSQSGIVISNNHAGNLSDFRKALPDFTPADNAGSPYCIKRYHVDSYFGGDRALELAREKLAQRGIRLILDFVPNHLAHDHPWVKEHPEFFIHGNASDAQTEPGNYAVHDGNIFACGKDPFYPAWQDVLQANAFNPGFREAVKEDLIRIAGQCDGVRCDMAMLVMNDIFLRTWGRKAGPLPSQDYWEMLIPAVKKHNPDFLFIAEAYWDTGWQLQQQGFDYCYDKTLYDRLVNEPAQQIRAHLSADQSYQSKLIRFIENHDEPRQADILRNGKGKAALVISSTLPGARLYHEGQFEGRRIRLPVFLRRRPWEPPDREFTVFALHLLSIVTRSLFRDGNWKLCEAYGWSGNESWRTLLSWCWQNMEERCLIVVNYSTIQSQGRISLPWAELAVGNWILTDILHNREYERTGDELNRDGLYVALGPWESHIFTFTRHGDIRDILPGGHH